MTSTKSSSVRIIGQDLSHLSEPCLFFIGCCGIFILYLIYGAVQVETVSIPDDVLHASAGMAGFGAPVGDLIVNFGAAGGCCPVLASPALLPPFPCPQEYLFKSSEIKTHFAALTAYQFLLCGLLALLESRLVNQPYKTFPPWLYLSLSLCTVGTILLSNAAVVYLNYPTQVIFKCCKLIPVMLGSIIVHGKAYALIDYISIACMIVGLVFFTLTDVQVQPNFEIKGVIAISIALCADGYIGNLQELAMKKYQLSSLQIVSLLYLLLCVLTGGGSGGRMIRRRSGRDSEDGMAYSYVNGFLILFFYLVGGFALVPAVKFASTEPITVFVYGSIFAVTGYFGIQFVLLLVHHFGALPAVTGWSSVYMASGGYSSCSGASVDRAGIYDGSPPNFPLRLGGFPATNEAYLWSGAMVAFGIYLSAYSKARESRRKKVLDDPSLHPSNGSVLHVV
ncbi:unnamed protein product [Schistocephalus solidus]|uniref:Adenosine 3'-phospho 5'-phosphosulfate transporter 2 n=1 Tax=Schistocephalus solidus TaxID=70667 RepID=A0A183SN81_SCHSO|nr:unnamed protein product [Schistocephalus solidus]